MENYQVFDRRRISLGFGDARILLPLFRLDISFWDNAIWGNEDDFEREREIFEALFPTVEYEWADFAIAQNIRTDMMQGAVLSKWKNKLLDAQAYWAHEYHQRDIFVTSDKNFNKLTGHENLPDAIIKSPELACGYP
ncbi:MAG: hypothetical protein GY952_11770 [Rhodobacteraceae bacterium]|nr:hypothetical protein [Paracoccaceae bacterium]